MRKNLLKMAAFASMMAFVACSSEDDLVPGNDESMDVEGTTIEIAVSNTGEGMSRTARPMGSSAADNNVDKILLEFYTSTDNAEWTHVDDPSQIKLAGTQEGIKLEHPGGSNEFGETLLTYNTADIDEDPSNTNPHISKTAKISLKDVLEENQYWKIVAYGYNDAFPYGDVTEKEPNSGIFKTGGSHGKADYALEEVFAGSATSGKVNKAKKFPSAPKVTLTRQVAGMLAYFKIPTTIGENVVTGVKVVANQKFSGFTFPATTDLKGLNGNTSVSEDPHVLMEFKLRTAPNVDPISGITVGGDGYYHHEETNDIAQGDVCLAKSYKPAANLTILANTFFGARYIIPYDKHYPAQTLTIEIYGGLSGGIEVNKIKTLNVKTNAAKPGTYGEIADWAHQYDIRCNNFYSIGKKLKTDDTDEGGENPDTPIDLAGKDEIIVEINDAWEVLHDMDIEE